MHPAHRIMWAILAAGAYTAAPAGAASTSLHVACDDGRPVIRYAPGNGDTVARWVGVWDHDRTRLLAHAELAPGDTLPLDDGAAWVEYPADTDRWRAVDPTSACTTTTVPPATTTSTTTTTTTVDDPPLSLITIHTTPAPTVPTPATPTLPETGGDTLAVGLAAGALLAGGFAARKIGRRL